MSNFEECDASKTGHDLDYQIGYLLRLANQRHATIFQSHSLYGLTPTQFAALLRVANQGPCSQNKLGRLAAMDVATIKGVVDRLRLKGFVDAKPDPTDKRRTLISLSHRGSLIREELESIGRSLAAETLSTLSNSEQNTLIRLLQKLA